VQASQKSANRVAVGLLLVAASACSHVTKLSDTKYPTHNDKVCILEGISPQGMQLVPVADLEIKLKTYGGDKRGKLGLAKYARKLGAQAVVDAEIWNVMGGPRAKGRAVRFASADVKPPTDCQWY
jgi:hypothetical protein